MWTSILNAHQSFTASFGTHEVDMNANASWRDVLEAYERDPAAPLVRQTLELAQAKGGEVFALLVEAELERAACRRLLSARTDAP